MCGRFVSTSTAEDLAALFCAIAPEPVEVEAEYNVAPATDIWTVIEPDENRLLTRMHWGLVPIWARDPSIGNRMINARAETLAEKNSFKSAFRHRRCLVPVDGFYEWKAIPGQPRKQPYFIHHPDGKPFAFAGLWERWRGPDRNAEHELRSATIITTDANEPLASLHHRMPVILDPDAWDLWLDHEVDDPTVLSELLVPAPPEIIAMHPVGTDVGNVRNRGPHLIEPVDTATSLF